MVQALTPRSCQTAWLGEGAHQSIVPFGNSVPKVAAKARYEPLRGNGFRKTKNGLVVHFRITPAPSPFIPLRANRCLR
jgi:hypothetical protein